MTLKKVVNSKEKKRLSAIGMNNISSKSCSNNNNYSSGHINSKLRKKEKILNNSENQEISNNILITKSANYIFNKINKVSIIKKIKNIVPNSNNMKNDICTLKFRNNNILNYNDNKENNNMKI